QAKTSIAPLSASEHLVSEVKFTQNNSPNHTHKLSLCGLFGIKVCSIFGTSRLLSSQCAKERLTTKALRVRNSREGNIGGNGLSTDMPIIGQKVRPNNSQSNITHKLSPLTLPVITPCVIGKMEDTFE